jgi:hypothetical protein
VKSLLPNFQELGFSVCPATLVNKGFSWGRCKIGNKDVLILFGPKGRKPFEGRKNFDRASDNDRRLAGEHTMLIYHIMRQFL